MFYICCSLFSWHCVLCFSWQPGCSCNNHREWGLCAPPLATTGWSGSRCSIRHKETLSSLGPISSESREVSIIAQSQCKVTAGELTWMLFHASGLQCVPQQQSPPQHSLAATARMRDCGVCTSLTHANPSVWHRIIMMKMRSKPLMTARSLLVCVGITVAQLVQANSKATCP